METEADAARRIQERENPGYMPDRVSFSHEPMSMPEFIAERKKRADEILAQWAKV